MDKYVGQVWVKSTNYSDEMEHAARLIAFTGHYMELKSAYELTSCVEDLEKAIDIIKKEYPEAFVEK